MAENKTILNLEDFLPYRLSVLSNTISRGIADLYAERFGLSISAWRVMAVLGRFPGLSANEVAERTAMDKVAVSRAVAQLQKAKLLARESAEDDRRRSVLALTDKGRTIHGQVAPLALAMERELLSPLTREEREMLDGLVTKLTACARTLSPGISGRAKKDYGEVL